MSTRYNKQIRTSGTRANAVRSAATRKPITSARTTARTPATAGKPFRRAAGRYKTPTRGATPRDVVARPRLTPTRSPALAGGKRIAPTPSLSPRARTIAPTRTATYASHANFHQNKAFTYGNAHWGNHYAALSFSWGQNYGAGWGCYSYPFFYGSRLPRYYNHCYTSFGFDCYPSYGFSYCFGYWPRFCSPLNWGVGLCLGGGWGGYWGGGWGGGDLYYSPTYSYAAVHEESVPSEVVSAGGPPAAETLEEVATRHISLGDFYFKEGRYDEAAESYMRALTYAPDDGTIHFLVADALFAQGDYHYAAYMVTKAISLDPELALAETDKRAFYGNPADFEAQMATLSEYLAEKPYDASAHLLRGYNLKFSGDPESAKLAFERVLEISPSDQTAKIFLEAVK